VIANALKVRVPRDLEKLRGLATRGDVVKKKARATCVARAFTSIQF
jgi:hypothetical protein